MPTVIHELADAFLRRKQALAERGQAKTKLAGSDYFMPKSAKQDLANRLSVFEQGGLPELLKQGASEMYHNPIVNTAISLTPGAGDVQSGYEAVQSAKEGNWGEAGLNALGVLPFIPALGGIVSPQVARELKTLRQLPEHPEFAQAVSNTPGAQITDEGLLMRVARGQKPEQEAMESVRGGVFYLPEGSSNMKHYKKGDYGGQQMIEGETLINNPLFVKGATGGKAPEAAYDQLMGKGAYQKMRQEALQASGVMNLRGGGLTEADKAERIARTLQEFGIEEHIAPDMAWNMLQNSKSGNQLPYAIQEAIVGNAVRNAGHDVVLGYSKGKQGPFLSEVFDVREPYYPYNTGEAVDIWDVYKK